MPQEEKTARKIVFESEQFIIDDGTLYHLFHPRTKRMDEIVPIVKQLCIPRILREELMLAYQKGKNACITRLKLSTGFH